MSPREVKGLNDLAMAHGGQLSINPQTGLPEAGFLESILPMVAGAALTATGVGAPMAALMVGGGMTLMTGSLQKGLMAGLGAYGGAGLGEGLAASGMDAAVAVDPAAQAAKAQIAENASISNSNFFDPTGTLKPAMQGQYIDAQKLAANNMVSARDAIAPGFMDKIGIMGKGVGTLGQEGGFSNLYQNLGGSPMSLISKLGSAAAPAIGEMMTPKKQEETKADSDLGQRYGFSMNPAGGQSQAQPGQDPLANTPSPTATPFPTPDIYGREQRYFAPSYSKLTPEDAKKLYGYADGGITGSGNLDLRIPLDLGGGSGGGSYGGGGNGGETYPFQGSGGFAGYNNSPQGAQQAQDQAQRMAKQASATHGLGASSFSSIGDVVATPGIGYPASDPRSKGPLLAGGSTGQFPYAAGGPRPEGLGSLFNAQTMADGGVATDPDRPTETPALQAFKQMQAQRAAQPPVPQIDANAEFAKYAQQTVGAPNQLQAPTAPPLTSTSLASSGYSYDPIKQQYGQIQGTAPAESTDPSANPFSVDNRPVVGYTSTGEKIYGEQTNNRHIGMGGMPMKVYASGGVSHLGDYSDGGRLLRGPGDGVSDSIPAMIGKRQPARLADGEFVVPARIVSELGNGSTEAGARKLYAMMDRIQKARGKTVGKNKVAKNSRSEKYLPA
jgi:hypothetical protein